MGFEAINVGGIGSAIFGWASNLLFWAGIIILMAVGTIAILYYRRRSRFEFPLVEIIGLGQGKIRLESSKAGWFKRKKIFFKLLDVGGEEELICKRGGRKIFFASSIDYHEINGKRGIICKRKDDDPEILVPLTRFEIKNPSLIGEIAPADYRDAAVQILDDKEKETLTWWEKNAPLILTLGVVLFSLIALIIIFQFAKGESSAWREAMIQMRTLASSAP